MLEQGEDLELGWPAAATAEWQTWFLVAASCPCQPCAINARKTGTDHGFARFSGSPPSAAEQANARFSLGRKRGPSLISLSRKTQKPSSFTDVARCGRA
jgi:hypothetical protein